MQVSVVSSHNQKKGLKCVDIEKVFEAIKTGGKQREQIEYIRKLVSQGVNGAVLRDEKAKLPAVLFNGVFAERNNAGLQQASGLMILDWDEISDDLYKIQDYVYAVFKSPTAKGFKALIRIPVVKSDAEYKTYFAAIQKLVPSIDPSGKDIARLCYFSFDDAIAIHEWDKVKVWTERIIPKPFDQPKFHNSQKNSKTDPTLIAKAMRMISNSILGTRHETALKAGRLIGGYVAGKQVDEFEAKDIMETHIMKHSPDDYIDHYKAFLDGIENGKKQPLTKKELKEIDEEDKLGTIHISLDEVEEKMDYFFHNGMPKGYKLGWKDLDENYTLVLGSTTYLYSSPYSGKSQFWNESLINLSKFYGMRHAIFSPETGEAYEIYTELCRIYAKKNYSHYAMTDIEREEAKDFIKRHFIVIDGDYFEKDLTIQDICDYTTMLETKLNQKIHTLTIDPYNELKHDYGNARDIHLEEELKFIRRNAKNNERHICIVTHVRDQEGHYVKDPEGGYTFYVMPTFRDIAGGQAWSRKGMMMLAVWRPIVVKKGMNKDTVFVGEREYKTNQLVVQVQKAKPKMYGQTGEVNLYYDKTKHSYYDDAGEFARHPEEQMFAKVEEKLVEEKENYPF